MGPKLKLVYGLLSHMNMNIATEPVLNVVKVRIQV